MVEILQGKTVQAEGEDNNQFKLREDIRLVRGASRAALYDLDLGKVYSINADAAGVIEGEKEDPHFRSMLNELGLIEDGKYSPEEFLKQERTKIAGLSFAWLEVTPACNETCIHCYGLFGRPQPSYQPLSFYEWTGVLDEISESGCRNIQVIGGEPFMYKDIDTGKNLIDLITYAREKRIEGIEVFTNGTMLTDRVVASLKDEDVRVAVSVYSHDSEAHDSITQLPGSHKLTMKGISKLKEAGIPLRLGFIAMRQNQSTISQTIEQFEGGGFRRRRPDVIRPSGGGEDLLLQPTLDVQKAYGLRMKPNFKTNSRIFNKHQSNNPCLSGKIVVSYKGDVFPCIFSRSYPVGNVRKQSISEIVQGEPLQEVWETTKDDVMVCQDCEYRYACHDCRPLALNSNPGADYLDAPPARCTYNPYTGTWGEGVWRLNSDGEPAYIYLEEVFRSCSSAELKEIGGDE